MPRRITLHHPDLDVTIVRTARQARVLVQSGWLPVSESTAPPPPEPDADGNTTEE